VNSSLIRNKTVQHIIKANVWSVADLSSHSRHATVRLPRQWHAAADQTIQQSCAASVQQRRVYCRL